MATTTPTVDRVLLPDNVKPSHYDIHLTPVFADFTFKGVERVDLAVLKATKSITFNCLEIEIQKAVVKVDDKEHTASKIDYDANEETATCALLLHSKNTSIYSHFSSYFNATFDAELPAGAKAVLVLDFTGVLNNDMCGFYRSKYEHNGQTRYLATSHFEPADARKAFPCWDEPALKATYTMRLTAPKDMLAISNMPQVSETTNEDGSKTCVFDKSPIMSTYLVAFCVGNLEWIETKSKNGVLVRVFTTPGKKETGRFALGVGAKIIDYFSEYYGIAYPLPKSDMVAIPDFSMGAMENWGLITYRETALLVDEQRSSVAMKGRVAYVVAHELAHQWFGNLVTMEWWKEIWLNEGFATFVGTQAVAHFFPEWDLWTQFLSDYVSRALTVDSLRNSHPIEVDVARARAINEIFDAISYCKGASVIRMLENYLGVDVFRKGLNIYLERFQYSNAKTVDLWKALSEGSGKDVARIMARWTGAIGYPVVTVSETPETGKYTVEQHRFLASGDVSADEDETVWVLNLGTATKSNPEIVYTDVSTRSATVDVKIASAEEWVKFNAGQSGFYRVAYSPLMSERLGKAILNGELSAADRLGIQSDAFALARAGIISLVQALQVAQNFVHEDDYTVWSDLSLNLGDVAALLQGTDAYPNFSKFVRSLYGEIASKLGWDPKEGEKDLHKQLRAIVLSKVSAHGDEAVVAEARKRFEGYLKDKTSLPSDLTGVVFKTAMRNGGEAEYNSLLELYKNAELPEERVRALSCSGFSNDPELILKALEHAISDNVRPQDTYFVFHSASSTPQGRVVCWDFVQKNWSTLNKNLGQSTLLGRVLQLSTSSGNTEEWLTQVEPKLNEMKSEMTERTIAQSLESIRGNIAYLKRAKDETSKWLKENFPA